MKNIKEYKNFSENHKPSMTDDDMPKPLSEEEIANIKQAREEKFGGYDKIVEVEGGLCHAEMNEKHIGKGFEIELNEDVAKHHSVYIRWGLGSIQLLNDNIVLTTESLCRENDKFVFDEEQGNYLTIKVPSVERAVSFMSDLLKDYFKREGIDLKSEKPPSVKKDFDYEID